MAPVSPSWGSSPGIGEDVQQTTTSDVNTKRAIHFLENRKSLCMFFKTIISMFILIPFNSRGTCFSELGFGTELDNKNTMTNQTKNHQLPLRWAAKNRCNLWALQVEKGNFSTKKGNNKLTKTCVKTYAMTTRNLNQKLAKVISIYIYTDQPPQIRLMKEIPHHPPCMKPVVNHGIFTYIYHINWLAG